MPWIGWGMNLFGWIAIGMDRFKFWRGEHLALAIVVLAFAFVFIGLTLNLIGATKESETKRLSEQAAVEAPQLGQTK